MARRASSRDPRRKTGLPALLVGLAAAACGPTAAPEAPAVPPRLVLLYAPCTVTRAHLSPYRPSVTYTPRLQEFARQATVFQRHQTEAGSSGIAYASLFAGAQADRHGVFRHPGHLNDDLYGIFQAFGDAGYATFYWNGHTMARSRLGYAPGLPAGRSPQRELQAEDPRFGRVLARLAREPDHRALIVTNLKLTHGPYAAKRFDAFAAAYPEMLGVLGEDPQPRYFGLYRQNFFTLSWNFPLAIQTLGLGEDEVRRLAQELDLLYAANVHELDRRFGAILDAIDAHGLADQSLVAFTADHGEVLRNEAAVFQWSHSMQLAPEVLVVPWLLRAPGLEPGRYESVSRSIDVYPTLAGLSGLTLPRDRGIQGVDLSPALRGESPAPELEAYSHTTVLPNAVIRQMQKPGRSASWARARGYFPTQDADPIWVALRRGDAFHRLRQLEPQVWSLTSDRLVEDPELGVARPDGAAPPDPEAAARLASYKARLVEAFSGDAQAKRSLPQREEADALRALGYIQ